MIKFLPNPNSIGIPNWETMHSLLHFHLYKDRQAFWAQFNVSRKHVQITMEALECYLLQENTIIQY